MTNRSERDILIGCVSDAYKDLYGVRPRWNWSAMSMAELQAEYDRLAEAVGAEIRREREHKEAVLAAMDDPSVFVVVDPWVADDPEYMAREESYGDYSHYSIYRPEPAPANPSMADALRRALGE